MQMDSYLYAGFFHDEAAFYPQGAVPPSPELPFGLIASPGEPEPPFPAPEAPRPAAFQDYSVAEPELLAQAPLKSAAGSVQLRIQAQGDAYNFSFSENGKAWTVLKDKVDGKFLSTQVAGGFIGCLFGMYGTSAGQPTANSAAFKWLKYEGHDPMYQK